jgi:hypothetical protein
MHIRTRSTRSRPSLLGLSGEFIRYASPAGHLCYHSRTSVVKNILFRTMEFAMTRRLSSLPRNIGVGIFTLLIYSSQGSSQIPPPANSSAYAWDIKYVADPMNDTTNIRATLSQSPEPGSQDRTVATATCGDHSMNFVIGHFSGVNQELGFKINYPPQTEQRQTVFFGTGILGIGAAFANMLSAAATASPQRDASPWVDYEIKVDNSFFQHRADSIYANVIKLKFDGSELDKIAIAKRVVISIPGADDSPIYFQFRPSEPSFQVLAAACGAEVPVTAAVIAAGYVKRQITPEELSNALTEVLSEIVQAKKLPKDSYRAEIARIVQIAKTCTLVNNEMLDSISPSKSNGYRSGQKFDFSKLGSAFSDCAVETPIDISQEIRKADRSSAAPKGRDILLKGAVTLSSNSSQGYMMSVFEGAADKSVLQNVVIGPDSGLKSVPVPQGWFWDGRSATKGENKRTSLILYRVGPSWIPLSGKVSLSYAVQGTKYANVKVELLRAEDDDGHPGEWSILATDLKILGMEGLTSVSFDDIPSKSGKYWYGTHIIDSTGVEDREPAPFLVRVAAPGQIAAVAQESLSGLFPGGTDVVLAKPVVVRKSVSSVQLADLRYDVHGVTDESSVLTVLDNSVWVPYGKPSNKQIYVVAAPCCAFSSEFWRVSHRYENQVQFRWVEMPDPIENQKCLNLLGVTATSTDAASLAQMYEDDKGPVSVSTLVRDNVVRWNRAVEVAINGVRKKWDHEHPGEVLYPELIWLARDGIKLLVRPNLSQLQSIIDSVVERPEAASVQPSSREFVNFRFSVQPTSPNAYYANEDDVKYFALPDVHSQPLFALPKNHGGSRAIGEVTVDGERWFEFKTPNGFPPIYVRASQVYARP